MTAGPPAAEARVFVVDRDAFFGGDWPQGFHPIGAGEEAEFLDRARRLGRFEPRPVAERTPAWKQWIPYCALRCVGPDGSPAGLFTVQRTSGQSESRLHGSWSIGLGGHVEPDDEGRPDPSGAAFFGAALGRELREELDFGTLPLQRPRFVGLINDDSTAVGSVHAGLAYVLDVPAPLAEAKAAVGIREISKMRGCFGSLVEFFELWQDPARFESWSRYLIEAGIAHRTGDFCRSS